MATVPSDLRALEARAVTFYNAQISDASRKMYQASAVRFIQWLYVNKPELLGEAFVAGIADTSTGPTKAYVLEVFGPPADINRKPLNFDTLRALDFTLWVSSLKKADGSEPGVSLSILVSYIARTMVLPRCGVPDVRPARD